MLSMDYGIACTQQFVEDVRKYCLTRFRLDGFRFDQVTGVRQAEVSDRECAPVDRHTEDVRIQ
jgi:pullulanase/glycogen debranching enzyme